MKGKTHSFNQRPILQMLVKGRYESTCYLKKRLISEGLKKEICECCKLKEWLGKPIPLELHHKNGDRKDNRLINLLLICPNCHAFTDNYRGKNKKVPPKNLKFCIDCKKRISKQSARCKSCVAKLQSTKIQWPETNSLLEMIENSSCLSVANKLGVSDNAIRKRLKNQGVSQIPDGRRS